MLPWLGLGRARAENEDDKWRVPLTVKASDPDGDPLTFRWTQLAGPKVKIADPATASTWFVPTEPGEYLFEIRVSDGKTEVVRQLKKTVTKPNLPPVADPGPDQNVLLGQKVRVDGSASKDPDGKIAEFKWTVAATPRDVKPKLTPKQLADRQFDFEPAEPGDYVFELTVSDSKLWSDPARTTVRVAPINHKPDVDVGEDEKPHELPVPPVAVNPPPPKPDALPVARVRKGAVIALGGEIVLDGSDSSDPLGELLTYFWTQQNKGQNENILRTFKHDERSAKGPGKTPFDCPVWRARPDKPGTYTFVLQVTAGKGAQERKAESEPVVYSVRSTNHAPKAEIFVPQPKVEKGQAVTLDGSKSSDEDGDEITFIWGASGEGLGPNNWVVNDGPKVQFVPNREGEYGVQLEVSDGKEKSAPAKVKIQVLAANRPPSVSVAARVEALLGQEVKIPVEVKDPENDRAEVEWSVVSPKDFKLPKESVNANPLVFTPKEKQVYVLSVVGWDLRGHGEAAQVQVVVGGLEVNLPPTALIEGPHSVLLGAQVRLSGEKSSDPEKKRLTYLWKQVLVEGGALLPGERPTPAEKAWEFTPEAPGEYQVQLVVNDGTGESAPCVWRFTVERDNRPPVAKIEGLTALAEGEETFLSGAGSTDPEGEKLTYRWRLLEPGAKAELEGRDQAKAKLKALEAGTVRVELVVNDGKSDSVPVLREFSVGRRNLAPVARPGGPDRADAGQEVILSAAASADPDGKIKEYYWSQVPEAGPALSLRDRDLRQETLRFRPLKPGAYVFQLVVVDNEGLKSKPEVWTVNVAGAGAAAEAPLAKVEVQGKGPFSAGQPVTLSAKGSFDKGGKPLTYLWRRAAGSEKLELPADAGESLSLTPPEAGEYVIELKISNGERESAPVSARFVVQGPDTIPTAAIAEPVPCGPGEKVLLDGSPSRDPKGKALDYAWRIAAQPEGARAAFPWFGARRQKVEVLLPKEGEYTFELKVSDGKNWSEPVTATVKTRPVNQPPVAVAVAATGHLPEDLQRGADPLALPYVVKSTSDPKLGGTSLSVEERHEVLLDGSGSSDPDKGPKPLTYTWKLVSGLRVENETQEGARKRFLPVRPGPLLWELTVNDGKADSKPAAVRVQVLKAGTLPVALPALREIEANVALRNQGGAQGVVELDGRPSKAAEGKKLQHIWKQVGGEDLQLRPEQLAKSRVGIKIFQPGKYRFILTVFDGEFYSLPTLVDVNVKDPSAVKSPAPGPETRSEVPPKAAPKPAGKVGEPPADDGGALLPPPKDFRQAGPKENVQPDLVSYTPPARQPVALPDKPAVARPVPDPAPPEPARQPAALPDKPAVARPAPDPAPPEPARQPAAQPDKPAVAHPKPDPAPARQPDLVPSVEGPAPAPPEPARPTPAPEPLVTPHGPRAYLGEASYRAKDPVFQKRRKRFEDLAAQPGREAEQQLVRGLTEKDKDLRALAAAGLVQRGLCSVPALLEVLASGSAEAQSEAHWALKELSRQEYGPEPAAWKTWWTKQSE